MNTNNLCAASVAELQHQEDIENTAKRIDALNPKISDIVDDKIVKQLEGEQLGDIILDYLVDSEDFRDLLRVQPQAWRTMTGEDKHKLSLVTMKFLNALNDHLTDKFIDEATQEALDDEARE